jgi:cytoskeleton protein RodZ
MFEIGSSLRGARERQQLELSQVEEATRIRMKYLEALEDERFDALPGTAYVKGFLRTYADYLGLDADQFVEEYNTRFAPAEQPEAAPPVRIRRPRRLGGAWLVAIPVAVAVGLFVWRMTSGGDHQRATPPPPPSTSVRVTTTTPTRPQVTHRPQAPARLALVAAHGPCWMSVRLGSDSGRLLYERTLGLGQSARFVAKKLWIRFGNPANLVATVNGKPAQLPSTFGNVVVTAGKLRPVG